MPGPSPSRSPNHKKCAVHPPLPHLHPFPRPGPLGPTVLTSFTCDQGCYDAAGVAGEPVADHVDSPDAEVVLCVRLEIAHDHGHLLAVRRVDVVHVHGPVARSLRHLDLVGDDLAVAVVAGSAPLKSHRRSFDLAHCGLCGRQRCFCQQETSENISTYPF